MEACEVAKEKKRKRAMSGPSRGSSSGAPLKYHMIYTPPMGRRADLIHSSGATARSSSTTALL
jgi:hypothetical protein